MPDTDINLVICWTGISGYMAACWRALAARPGIQLRLVLFPTFGASSAPFDPAVLQGLTHTALSEAQFDDADALAQAVAAYEPDVIVISGWIAPAIRQLPFHPKTRGARFIMAMDTPRKDTWRQRLARLKIGRYVDRIDHVIVAGERSFQLARLLHVPESKITRGVYGFDAAPLDALYDRRRAAPGGWPRRFLFVGRYHEQKGIDTLVTAYAAYRKVHPTDAWPLVCCGQGPLKHLLSAPGIEDRGFVQPADQADVWAAAGVFIFPSRYEPWGVALAEAAYSGLPILCTEACGSSVEIVRTLYNGITVPTDDAAALARAMTWMHDHNDQLPDMGARSRQLATPFSARFWVDRWEKTIRTLMTPAPRP